MFKPFAQLYDALCASQDEIHLVLLDILMGEGDGGMRLAARLREMGNQVSIILVSSSPDFILQGYDVQAIKYLLKPVSSEDLRAAVLYDYRNHYKKRYLGLKIGSTVHSLSLWKIDCFEIKGKQVAVWHQGGVHYYRGKISELEPLLPSEFFRCHQSFIINLDNAVAGFKAYFFRRAARGHLNHCDCVVVYHELHAHTAERTVKIVVNGLKIRRRNVG